MNNEEKILQILEVMQGDVSSLKSDVSSLKDQVREHSDRLDRIENRIIVMENDHCRRLGGLEDGQSLLHDITSEIRQDVKELKSGSERHDLEIKAIQFGKAR